MQAFLFLWIALCLVVQTNTKSVRSSYNETAEHGSPLTQQYEICTSEHIELCKKFGQICVIDEAAAEGFRCGDCTKEREKDDESICVVKCYLEKYKNMCNENGGKVCVIDETEDEGFRCDCKKGQEEDDGECIGKCTLEKYEQICKENGRVCVTDEIEDEGYRCDCKKGQVEDNDKNCVEDKCLKICDVPVEGHKDIKCNGNRYGDDEDVSCECINPNLKFISTEKKCKVDPCAIHPCENGGTCEVEEEDYKCKCIERFKGRNCSKETCLNLEEEICGNVPCVYDKLLGGSNCVCGSGKVFDPNTKTCIADPCAIYPCKNGGTCFVEEKDYKCECIERFSSGVNCDKEICLKVEAEKCGNQTCVYDKLLGEGTCVCGRGKVFDPKSKTCKDADPCLMKILHNECNKPHETCKDGNCDCENNYKYNKEKTSCEENFCENISPCPRNFDCTELGSGNVLCNCQKGFFQKGGTCKPINLCTPGLVQCEQSCNKTSGQCICHPGFTPDNGKCKPIKEPDSDCDKECGVGICVKRSSDNICLCPSVTHIFNGTTCIDKCTHNKFKAPEDMCPSNECELSDKHVFRCKCKDPFELDEDGVHCRKKAMCKNETVIAECAKKSAICKEIRTRAGYWCECDDGFERENGTCIRKCDTKASHASCDPKKATCKLISKNSIDCECPPLVKKDQNGVCDKQAEHSFTGELSILKYKYVVRDTKHRIRRSTDEIDFIMLEEDIQNAVKQTYQTLAKIIHCKVEGIQVLCTLELQLNSGSEERANLILSKSVCLPLDEEHCVVKPSLILKIENEPDFFHKTDVCKDETVKNKLCGNSTVCVSQNYGDFTCRCKKGFSTIGVYHPIAGRDKTVIQKCDDINECSNATACPPSTDCHNDYGGYHCTCKHGYKKKTTNSDPKIDGCDAYCEPNPCSHGTCVVVDNHGFSCNCTEGYTGVLCNTTLNITPDPCDWNPCMNEGVCKIENETVKCYCKEPFTGKFCESPIKFDVYVVTLLAASVFSALVMIIVTCVKCQRCRATRTV